MIIHNSKELNSGYSINDIYDLYLYNFLNLYL